MIYGDMFNLGAELCTPSYPGMMHRYHSITLMWPGQARGENI